MHFVPFFSWERIHLVFAFAQGLHAEPHPADHFILHEEDTKHSRRKPNFRKTSRETMSSNLKETIGIFVHSSTEDTEDDVEIEVTTHAGLWLSRAFRPKFPRSGSGSLMDQP